MKKLFNFTLAIILMLGLVMIAMPSKNAEAKYGLKRFWCNIVSPTGDDLSETASVLTVTVMTVDTYTPATIYKDENASALSNTSGFDPNADDERTLDSTASWWSVTTSFDVKVDNGTYWEVFEDVTIGTHQLVFIGKELTPQSSTPNSHPGKVFQGTNSLNGGKTYIGVGPADPAGGAASWDRLDS